MGGICFDGASLNTHCDGRGREAYGRPGSDEKDRGRALGRGSDGDHGGHPGHDGSWPGGWRCNVTAVMKGRWNAACTNKAGNLGGRGGGREGCAGGTRHAAGWRVPQCVRATCVRATRGQGLGAWQGTSASCRIPAAAAGTWRQSATELAREGPPPTGDRRHGVDVRMEDTWSGVRGTVSRDERIWRTSSDGSTASAHHANSSSIGSQGPRPHRAHCSASPPAPAHKAPRSEQQPVSVNSPGYPRSHRWERPDARTRVVALPSTVSAAARSERA